MTVLKCTIAGGTFHARVVFIPRINFRLDPEIDLNPFTWMQREFLIHPAFAMKINQAQGKP